MSSVAESFDNNSLDNNEDSLVDVSDDDLYKKLEELLRSNDTVRTENEIFEKYLKRVDPQSSILASSNFHTFDSGPRMSRKRSKSRSSNSDRLLRLTYEQKCDIAQREIEELREELNQLSKDSEKIIDTYKAVMEEADIRLAENSKVFYEFERDIVKGSMHPRTKKVMAEKVMRHFEEKMRQRETLIEKLRLKNSSFKVQRRKLQAQLRQKEEMGEVLHEVDFEQLKIENAQYLEKIDEKNQELLRLKQMAGKTLQVLNSYKKKLNAINKQSLKLKTEISSREDLIRRVDEETILVEEEKDKAEVANNKRREELADFRVPPVMDYVKCVAENYELKHKERIWARKVDIARMAVDRHRKIWQGIRRGASAGI